MPDWVGVEFGIEFSLEAGRHRSIADVGGSSSLKISFVGAVLLGRPGTRGQGRGSLCVGDLSVTTFRDLCAVASFNSTRSWAHRLRRSGQPRGWCSACAHLFAEASSLTAARFRVQTPGAVVFPHVTHRTPSSDSRSILSRPGHRPGDGMILASLIPVPQYATRHLSKGLA